MNRRQEQRNNEEGNAVGGGDARFDLNQMVDRLREFLVNVEQNFPAAANNENDDQENYYDEEFD